MWPIRKIFPLRVDCVRDRDPEPVAQAADELRRVDPSGARIAVDDRRAIIVGREELEPHRLRALAAGAPGRMWPVEDGLRPWSSRIPSATSSPAIERDRRRERASSVDCPFRVRSQSK